MLILGLLLVVCTVAFTILALAGNLSGGPDYDVKVLGHHLATMNSLSIFCAGLALALLFGLGCVMTLAGGALRRRKMRKLHAARRDAAATARERDELAARLERERERGGAAGSGPVAEPGSDEPGYVMTKSDDASEDASEGGADQIDPQPTTRPRSRARQLFGH